MIHLNKRNKHLWHKPIADLRIAKVMDSFMCSPNRYAQSPCNLIHCHPSVRMNESILSFDWYDHLRRLYFHRISGLSSSSTLLCVSLNKLSHLSTFFYWNMWHHKQLVFSYEFQLVCTVPFSNRKFDDWLLFNPGACFLVGHSVNRQNSQGLLCTLQNK